MTRGRTQIGLLAATTVLALALPASATGAITFGSDLEPNPSRSLFIGFTIVQRALEADDRAPGGATVPSDGVITSWRVKDGAGSPLVRFRVVRGNTSVHQGDPTVIPSAAGIHRFQSRISVRAGDAIGIDSLGSSLPTVGASGGSWEYWSPPGLGGGETLPPSGSEPAQLLLNAELEPDADDDGFGDETQDGCPTNPLRQDDCSVPPDADLPDTDPPETTITKRASNKLDRSKARFKFVSDDATATFECKKDKRPYKACSSPKKLKRLDEGKHKFRVRAIDPAGNVDETPAKDKFRVIA